MLNKYQKEVEKQLLDNEKEILSKLKNNYAKALKDVKQRIKDLQSNELTQSKIYQIQYQQNLEKQIQSIIDLLSSDNIKSITDYLNLMYRDGFIGTQYNMYKEGVPFVMPIDQELVLKSITKKTEEFQLSQALYQNAEALKSTIIAEVTRGISQSVAYNTIAKKLAMHSEADLKKAYRIARTEGGRVQTEAKFEAMTRAKNNGADVVKQWDSTLDSRTRLSHAKLDGQVRELEEKFEVDGHTAMYPHGFGIAEEDINCRCALLERARWAVEYENKKGFTKNVDGDIVEFKNLKDYQDFKAKYFNFYENYDKIPNNVNEFYKYAVDKGYIKELTTFKVDENGVVRGQILNKILGYDKLPKKVTQDEYEKLKKISNFGELYRGISADTKELGLKYIDSFKNGKFFAGITGAYGRGTYVAYGEEGLRLVKTNYTDTNGGIIKMLLDNNAKTINFVELDRMRRKELNDLGDNVSENFKMAILMDNGYYASIKGYDAIIIDKTIADLNKQPYIVILNRGKVIVSD